MVVREVKVMAVGSALQENVRHGDETRQGEFFRHVDPRAFSRRDTDPVAHHDVIGIELKCAAAHAWTADPIGARGNAHADGLTREPLQSQRQRKIPSERRSRPGDEGVIRKRREQQAHSRPQIHERIACPRTVERR